MRRALLAAALAAALLLTACAGPRNALNTPASTCFRGLPAAEAAVGGGKARLVGVRRIERGPLVAKVPQAARVQARSVCLVAYRGPFGPGDVPGADPPGPGTYALVAVDDRSFLPLAQRLVVIGGDAAGMSAASQARRRRGPDELEIVAFDKGNFVSYSACGIPYYVSGVVDELDRLLVRQPDVFRDNYAIEAKVRHQATEIDLDRGAVLVRDLDAGLDRWEPFDDLVVATGAIPRRPSLPGAHAPGIFGVQTLDDGVALRRYVAENHPARAVIVGGGYVGLEMAEACCALGIETHLVDGGPQPMPTLDPDMGALVARALVEFGTILHMGEEVTAFETSVGGGGVAGVATAGGTIPADLVVLGLGVRPNADLAGAAGLAVGPSGGIAVDRRMRTSHAGVWSAGDCAEKFHRVSGQRVAVALGTHANKEGRVAGINLGGGYATFPGVIGTAATKVGSLEVARTGLNEAQAASAGFVARAVVSESTTRAGYYPGAAPITTKLVVEQGTGRLLGAQIVGRQGAAKRIDALALAVWHAMDVEDLLSVDLSYAPPYSPVWDPVLAAARRAYEH